MEQEESRSTVKWILRDIEALGDKPMFVFHIGDTSVMPEVFPGYGMSSSIKLNLLPPTYLTMSASVTMSMIGHHNLGDQIGPTASMGRVAVGNVAFHSASDSKCLAIHHFQHLLDLQTLKISTIFLTLVWCISSTCQLKLISYKAVLSITS